MLAPQICFSSSLEEAEQAISTHPSINSLFLQDNGTSSYKEIEEKDVLSFRKAILKHKVKRVVLQLPLSYRLAQAFRGANIKILKLDGGSSDASQEKIDQMISSMKMLTTLTIEKLEDGVMYSKLHACLRNFSGSLVITHTVIRPDVFSKVFCLSRITRFVFNSSNRFLNEIDETRFFRSLSCSKTLRSVMISGDHLDSIFPTRHLATSDERKGKGMIAVQTRKSLFTFALPKSLQMLSFWGNQSQLSRPLFKALVASIVPERFPVNGIQSWEPFTEKFISRVMNN